MTFIDTSGTNLSVYGKSECLAQVDSGPTPWSLTLLYSYWPGRVACSSCFLPVTHYISLFFHAWLTLTMSTSPSYLPLNFMQNPSNIKEKHTVGIHGKGSESKIKSWPLVFFESCRILLFSFLRFLHLRGKLGLSLPSPSLKLNELCCNEYLLWSGIRQQMRQRVAIHRPEVWEQWSQEEESFSPAFFPFQSYLPSPGKLCRASLDHPSLQS